LPFPSVLPFILTGSAILRLADAQNRGDVFILSAAMSYSGALVMVRRDGIIKPDMAAFIPGHFRRRFTSKIK
jgi:hypothetical protein